MISIIINNHDNDRLAITLENLCKTQKSVLDKIHIIVMNATNDIDISEVINKYSDKIDISIECESYENQWEIQNKILKKVKTKFVAFADSGIEYAKNILKYIFSYMNNSDDRFVSLGLFTENVEFDKSAKECKNIRTVVRLNETPDNIPICIDNIIFRTSTLKLKEYKSYFFFND